MNREFVLTVQTHQHCVSLQLGDMDCIHLLIPCSEEKHNTNNPVLQHIHCNIPCTMCSLQVMTLFA